MGPVKKEIILPQTEVSVCRRAKKAIIITRVACKNRCALIATYILFSFDVTKSAIMHCWLTLNPTFMNQ